MFSGLTQGLYPVVRLKALPDLIRYQVELSASLIADLKVGDSVAIDGVCQSVTAIEGRLVSFDGIGETLRCTTLNTLAPGRLVSVELSLRVGDRIGGHEMSGHVVGTIEIVARDATAESLTLVCHCPLTWLHAIFPKGFVALDGSSLTVGEVDLAAETFTVHLIPETLRATQLGKKALGDLVNLELDFKTQAIVETVARLLQTQKSV